MYLLVLTVTKNYARVNQQGVFGTTVGDFHLSTGLRTIDIVEFKIWLLAE